MAAPSLGGFGISGLWVWPLCCVNIALPAAYQLAESSTNSDGGWHTKACHPVQRIASKADRTESERIDAGR